MTPFENIYYVIFSLLKLVIDAYGSICFVVTCYLLTLMVRRFHFSFGVVPIFLIKYVYYGIIVPVNGFVILFVIITYAGIES